jgi:hypothetical protein
VSRSDYFRERASCAWFCFFLYSSPVLGSVFFLYSSYKYLNTRNFTISFDHLAWNIMITFFDLNLACNGRGGGISGADFVDGHPRHGLHAARCELGAMVRSELGVTARSELGMICSSAEPRHMFKERVTCCWVPRERAGWAPQEHNGRLGSESWC